jgi:hypothetical protein
MPVDSDAAQERAQDTAAMLPPRRRRPVLIGAAVLLLGALGLGVYSLQKNKTVGLSARAYNYSQDHIAFVAVNGKWAGGGDGPYDPAKRRGPTGGGSVCCVNLIEGGSTAEVELKFIDGSTLDVSTLKVQAQVLQPWPKFINTANIYVLPGRRVVIEITPGPGIALTRDELKKRMGEN